MSDRGQGAARPQRGGIEICLEASETPDELAESLRGLTGGTAFYFAGLSHDADESLPQAYGGRWQQHYRARFALEARQGVVGDPQIFALLRSLTGRYRWSRVERVQHRTAALPRLLRSASG